MTFLSFWIAILPVRRKHDFYHVNLANFHKEVVPISEHFLFAPVRAKTFTAHTEMPPVAHDCVKIIVVRAGGALLCTELGICHVNAGDVIVLSANVLCGAKPEGGMTATTLYLDRDFVVDQVFWQYAAQFVDRFDAHRFLDATYTEPAQVVRLGEDHAGALAPWLDELAALSVDGFPPERYYRAQSLLFSVLDIVVPLLAVTDNRPASTLRANALPTPPRHRRFLPLRGEARHVENLLRSEIARRWKLSELADAVHLSPSQLGRVFLDAYGKSPIAYLTMLRTERMAELLRMTDESIAIIAGEVGWGDPDFASLQFRRSVGVSPSAYRTIRRRIGDVGEARDSTRYPG